MAHRRNIIQRKRINSAKKKLHENISNLLIKECAEDFNFDMIIGFRERFLKGFQTCSAHFKGCKIFLKKTSLPSKEWGRKKSNLAQDDYKK